MAKSSALREERRECGLLSVRRLGEGDRLFSSEDRVVYSLLDDRLRRGEGDRLRRGEGDRRTVYSLSVDLSRLREGDRLRRGEGDRLRRGEGGRPRDLSLESPGEDFILTEDDPLPSKSLRNSLLYLSIKRLISVSLLL